MHTLALFLRASTITMLLYTTAIPFTGFTTAQTVDDPGYSRYLEVVRIFADSVLANGRDTYGQVHSPLFADGINVDTGEPVQWTLDGETWILSNYGSQQNLMRILDSLTELTGDQTYREAAAEATRYMFEHHTDSRGLLYWGGHQFVDLNTQNHHFEGDPHELKNNFPYYEFMWRVNQEATARMLRAVWNAHMMDWSKLDMNRHGPYNSPQGLLWDHEFVQPEPFFEGRGLTFINFGTDMMHVGLSLYFLGNEEGARTWGIRLFEQYVRARHPETGLGVYQYSQPLQRDTPPEDGPLTGTLTYSGYGDRARNQFGRVYGDIALEGNALWGYRIETIYGRSPVLTLHLAEQLQGTAEGDYLLEKTLEGMVAISRYSYDADRNIFRPLWADGTDLSGHVLPRTGYFGREGEPFELFEPDGLMVLAYARAARLSDGNPELWHVLRHMIMAQGLGDIGVAYGSETHLHPDVAVTDPNLLVAILELYRATGNSDYLHLAETIGDNIINRHYHHGYFMPSEHHIYARFDSLEPLALITLEAVRRGTPDVVPPYLASYGSTQGGHDDHNRTIRDWIFYDKIHQ
jgi:pectate lyase